MINFIFRYLMPHHWRWNKWMEDLKEIRQRYPSPYYVGIPTERLLEFCGWKDELADKSKEYWRV